MVFPNFGIPGDFRLKNFPRITGKRINVSKYFRSFNIKFVFPSRCVALDMRGYGDSDKPEGVSPYEVDTLSDDIKSVIKGLGREKCILVCHDWGAVIGWNFVQNNMNMIEKYVMMGAPSAAAWRKAVMSSDGFDQFKKSWYIFYFQMPRLPEFTISLDDFAIFKAIGSSITEDDLEAYKYTFSRPGMQAKCYSI